MFGGNETRDTISNSQPLIFLASLLFIVWSNSFLCVCVKKVRIYFIILQVVAIVEKPWHVLTQLHDTIAETRRWSRLSSSSITTTASTTGIVGDGEIVSTGMFRRWGHLEDDARRWLLDNG